MDFSAYPLSERYYGGSEKKIGVLIGNSEYMLKFQTRTAFGLRMNHVSEYLGCHVFELMGIPAQESYLGRYMGEEVVACKNFIGAGEQFVPFNDVGESTLDQDRERYQYEYADVMEMLRDNSKLTHVQETIAAFWQIYVIDALLGNFDRHGSNWGFIKKDRAYSLAPVFDNGSCLFPQMTDEEEMKRIMTSREETDRRVYTFPTSQIRLMGKKSSYFEIIHSLAFSECNSALKAVMERADIRAMERLIEQVPYTSDARKDFLRHILRARYEGILMKAYLLLEGRA